MRSPQFSAIAAVVILSAGFAFGLIDIKTQNEDNSASISGDVGLQTGQAVNYYYKDYHEYHHQWIQQTLMHFNVDAAYHRNLKVKLGIEGRLWFSLPDQSNKTTGQAYALYDKIFSFTIPDAYGLYALGDPESPFLSFTAGMFSYKYNPDVRNLGEYLFRSLTYPAVLINYFDQAYARLTGLKISGNLGAGSILKLHGDFLLTLETEMYPFFDITPSFIGNCNLGGFCDFGLGVSMSRLFPVNDSITTPRNDPRSRYITGTGDTGYYTFSGTKIMVRLSLDPKKIFPFDCLGPEECKLYTEAAIIGLKNYPKNDSQNSPFANKGNLWGYDTLSQKIPVVIGFTLPTFKLLNLLGVEAQWYGCTYPMNIADAVRLGNKDALPIPSMYSKPPDYYLHDNWKWSVYAKKTFADDHLSIILQVARDHLRFQHILDEPKVYEEALVRPGNWWWTSKLSWNF